MDPARPCPWKDGAEGNRVIQACKTLPGQGRGCGRLPHASRSRPFPGIGRTLSRQLQRCDGLCSVMLLLLPGGDAGKAAGWNPRILRHACAPGTWARGAKPGGLPPRDTPAMLVLSLGSGTTGAEQLPLCKETPGAAPALGLPTPLGLPPLPGDGGWLLQRSGAGRRETLTLKPSPTCFLTPLCVAGGKKYLMQSCFKLAKS